MFIVVYRQHNAMHAETEYYGPFADFAAAYAELCSLPALGIHVPEGDTPNSGVKFVQELLTVRSCATQNRVDHARDVEVLRKGASCGEGAVGPVWLATTRANRMAFYAQYTPRTDQERDQDAMDFCSRRSFAHYAGDEYSLRDCRNDKAGIGLSDADFVALVVGDDNA